VAQLLVVANLAHGEGALSPDAAQATGKKYLSRAA